MILMAVKSDETRKLVKPSLFSVEETGTSSVICLIFIFMIQTCQAGTQYFILLPTSETGPVTISLQFIMP